MVWSEDMLMTASKGEPWGEPHMAWAVRYFVPTLSGS